MENREKILQQAEDFLKSANLTVDDLVQYCAEKETVKAEGIVQRFAFEVMYEGMVRSWVPLEGKKPLGVIFENHLITLHDSPRKMTWKEAIEYCRRIKIGGHVCNAGKIGFWKRLLRFSEQQKEAFDDLFIGLGGEALVGKWFWSSSESDNYIAWVFCTDTGGSQGGVYNLNKSYDDSGYVVRPVLHLSKLSL